jgi:hypothetical protein
MNPVHVSFVFVLERRTPDVLNFDVSYEGGMTPDGNNCEYDIKQTPPPPRPPFPPPLSLAPKDGKRHSCTYSASSCVLAK